MNVKDAIEARRSIRKFTERPVGSEDVAALLEAARLAPSGCNSQPWRFKAVTKREDIQWIAHEGSNGQRWAAGAGAVIICCVDPGAFLCDSRKTVRMLSEAGMLPPEMKTGIEQYLDRGDSAPRELVRASAGFNLAIAVSFMLLRAVELGLGTTWMGMFLEDRIKERFHIPEQLAVMSLLAVGHPAESPTPRPRKALQEIVIP